MTDDKETCKMCENCDMSCKEELPPEAGGPITVTDELGRDVTYE